MKYLSVECNSWCCTHLFVPILPWVSIVTRFDRCGNRCMANQRSSAYFGWQKVNFVSREDGSSPGGKAQKIASQFQSLYILECVNDVLCTFVECSWKNAVNISWGLFLFLSTRFDIRPNNIHILIFSNNLVKGNSHISNWISGYKDLKDSINSLMLLYQKSWLHELESN